MPIAARGGAFAGALGRCIGAPLPGTARRAGDDGDAALAIAAEHLLGRMAEAVAVASLEDGDPRPDGVEERRARRGLAAVVRRDQDIALQRRAVGDDQRCLLVALD